MRQYIHTYDLFASRIKQHFVTTYKDSGPPNAPNDRFNNLSLTKE